MMTFQRPKYVALNDVHVIVLTDFYIRIMTLIILFVYWSMVYVTAMSVYTL